MKTIKSLLMTSLLVVLMASCGPSYVGVGTAPAYGPGYYAPRPYYGYRPYGYYGYQRPPIIVERRTYVVPRNWYYNRPSYSPNARANRYGNGYYRGNGRSRGPR